LVVQDPQIGRAPVETDPSRICERFVDLEGISVLGVEGDYREPLTVHFESRRAVVGCPECGWSPG
jgi:hypothetical protein